MKSIQKANSDLQIENIMIKNEVNELQQLHKEATAIIDDKIQKIEAMTADNEEILGENRRLGLINAFYREKCQCKETPDPVIIDTTNEQESLREQTMKETTQEYVMEIENLEEKMKNMKKENKELKAENKKMKDKETANEDKTKQMATKIMEIKKEYLLLEEKLKGIISINRILEEGVCNNCLSSLASGQ